MLSRRGLLKIGAASVGSLALRPLGLLPALAQSSSPDYRALVCVFLFGGNDSNNTIIPADDANFRAYTAIRGQLALGPSSLTAHVHAASTNAPFAFHGALSELASMFSNKELAVVANVGSLIQATSRQEYQKHTSPVPVNLFSHADQQAQWQTGVSNSVSLTGWAGRAADIVSSQNSSFPTFLSVAGNTIMGAGNQTNLAALSPGQSLDLFGYSGSDAATVARRSAMQSLLTFENGLSLVQSANQTLSQTIADAQSLDAATAKSAPLKTIFPATGLGNQLKQVAEIIQVRDTLQMKRQIFFCSLGGFDTHTAELITHKNVYGQLSQALAAFNNAMQELGTNNDVTTFTESEFSRTFQPTSGDGSDHAWGSHHMVMGGAVKGGDIYGSFPTFELSGPDDADYRGRWIPSTSIDQYGATLCSWFGVGSSDLLTVFPHLANFSTKNIGFLG